MGKEKGTKEKIFALLFYFYPFLDKPYSFQPTYISSTHFRFLNSHYPQGLMYRSHWRSI